jgi:predicted phosphohydrolase
MDVFGDRWYNHVERIKESWCSTINESDTVIVPGDISWGLKLEDAVYDLDWIDSLPGRKILIKGNHDKQYDMSLFEEITDFKTISANGIYIAMMHYPMLSWPKSHHGSLQLHGHVHGRREDNEANRDAGILRYDVGVDANNYCPVSIHQITTFFGI